MYAVLTLIFVRSILINLWLRALGGARYKHASRGVVSQLRPNC
jgi:hypothetical protein